MSGSQASGLIVHCSSLETSKWMVAALDEFKFTAVLCTGAVLVLPLQDSFKCVLGIMRLLICSTSLR